MQTCPCGSQLDFSECCRPYHQGQSAPSAEATMRARYSAYVLGDLEYLQKSHHSSTGNTFNHEEARAWSKRSTWLGLTILQTQGGGAADQEGTVEFIARYQIDGKNHDHHELAQFKKENGTWYFVDGQMLTSTVVRQAPKTGRNDPCPCGSGKKFKKCCG